MDAESAWFGNGRAGGWVLEADGSSTVALAVGNDSAESRALDSLNARSALARNVVVALEVSVEVG